MDRPYRGYTLSARTGPMHQSPRCWTRFVRNPRTRSLGWGHVDYLVDCGSIVVTVILKRSRFTMVVAFYWSGRLAVAPWPWGAAKFRSREVNKDVDEM